MCSHLLIAQDRACSTSDSLQTVLQKAPAAQKLDAEIEWIGQKAETYCDTSGLMAQINRLCSGKKISPAQEAALFVSSMNIQENLSHRVAADMIIHEIESFSQVTRNDKKSSILWVQMHLLLGGRYARLNRMDSMLYCANSAEALIQQLSPYYQIRYYSLKANISEQNKNYRQGLAESMLMYEISRNTATHMQSVIAQPYLNLCFFYTRLLKPDSAMMYINRGIETVRGKNDYWTAKLLLNKGYALHRKADFKGYLTCTDSCLYYALRSGETQIICKAYSQKANALQKNQRYDECIQTLQEVVAIGTRTRDFGELMDAYRIMMDASYAKGDFKQAILYQNKQYEFRDSLFQQSKIAEMNALSVKYETQKKDNELLKMRNKNARINLIVGILLISLLLAIAVAVIFGVRQYFRKRLYEKSLLAEKMQLAEELAQQEIKLVQAKLEGTEKERKRLSYLLHDEVSGSLSAVNLILDRLKNLHTNNPESSKLIDSAYEIEKGIYAKVHNLSHNLHPYTGDNHDRPFAVNLKAFAESFVQSMAVEIAVLIDNTEDLNGLSPEQQLVCYRVVQESMTNINKYAKATEVTIETYSKEGKIYLSVTDNGVGFDAGAHKMGIGHRNLQDQVSAISGVLHIQSSPGKGTTVEVVI